MELTFLTPLAAIFAASAVVPLAVFSLRVRRARTIRTAIGLEQPSRGSWLPLAAALAAVCVLLGVASAQPVVGTTRSIPERTDAEAFFVLDTSRSMLASESPDSATRFDRARDVAIQLRDRIPQVRAGIVSMTDRLLPHAFPTTDRRVFVSTLRKAMDVERPPPVFTYSTQATSYELLGGIAERKFFSNRARKRLLVVLTDGESRPFGSELGRAFRTKPPIETVFVRFWDKGERIYETGVAEGGYTPNPALAAGLDRAAALVGGRVYDERNARGAAKAITEIIGEGKTNGRPIAGSRLALMPYVTLAAFLPLAFLLWRRNR